MSTTPTTVVHRRRRHVELLMILLAQAIGVCGYILTHLLRDNAMAPDWPWVAAIWVGIGVLVHLVVRIFTPYADPLIMPCVLLLNGLGLVMIHRLDLASRRNYDDANTQLMWTGLAILCFVITLFIVRDHRRLARFPYLFFVAGLALLLLPLVPGLGVAKFGARIWIQVGPFSFQPGEFAKIALTLAFAGYLVEKRDVLALAGRRFLGIDWPRPRDLGPILIMWVAAVMVLVFETDLGSSLLFFGLFVVMLYVATERPGWAILGVGMFAVAAVGGYFAFRHVRKRVDAWLFPFDNYDQNYQIIQAAFGIDFGGLVGRGLGLGSPWMIPVAKSDMIAASLAEELGLSGFMVIVLLYAFIVARGLRTALSSREPFGKLLATGLAFTFALQVFVILGGVTRLLPLTGLTSPFMSQGGTSLVANYVIIALLLAISHQSRRPQPPAPPVAPAAPVVARAVAVGDDSPTQVVSLPGQAPAVSASEETQVLR